MKSFNLQIDFENDVTSNLIVPSGITAIINTVLTASGAGAIGFDSTTTKLKFYNGVSVLNLLTDISGISAGGDLTGTYPNPTVVWANGYTTYDARYLKLSGGTLTGALILQADPITGLGAATKNYVDNLINGITWKNAVAVATTTNITLSGEQTIDGVLTSSSRVLVKNQSTATANGIYVSASGAWTRSLDEATAAEILGATVYVISGTVNGGTQWNNNNTSIILGTTNITFVQIGGVGTYTPGIGLTLTGNVFSISTSYVGQASITTVGTLTTGATGTGFTIALGSSTITGVLPLVNGGAGTVNGILKANGSGIVSQAIVGTDYITATSTNTFTNKSGLISQWTNDSGYLTSNQSITLSGDVTGTGGTAITTTIGANKVTNSMLAGSITAAKLVGTDIATVGTITTGTLGSGAKVLLGSDATGDIYYNGGSGTLTRLGIGSTGNVLTVTAGVPAWESLSAAGLVTGTGVANQISYWTGASSQGGDATFIFNPTNIFLGIGGTPAAKLHIQGNISAAAWTTSGINIRISAATFTDATSSGTVAASYVNVLSAPTLVSLNATTYTLSGTLYVDPPISGTNVTQPNASSIVLGGAIIFNGAGGGSVIGTFDNQELQIRTNNTMRMRISAGGLFSFGNSVPAALIDVNGASGVISAAAWTTNGLRIRARAFTLTDTTSSGTVATVYGDYFGVNTFAASSSTTYTNAFNVFVDNIATGSNVTIGTTAALGLGGNCIMTAGSGYFIKKGGAGTFGTLDGQSVNIGTGATSRSIWDGNGRYSQVQDALSSGITPFIQYTQAAHTGGAQPGLLWTAGALTNQTTATEVVDINYNLSAVMKMVDGTVPTQRSFIIQGRTYTPQTSALILTTAVTLDVTSSIAGSGTTITNNYAIASRGNILMTGSTFNITAGTAAIIGTTDVQTLSFKTNGTNRQTIGSSGNFSFSNASTANTGAFLNFIQAANTGGVAGGIAWTAATHINVTATSELIDQNWANNRTVQWATGTVPLNRSVVFGGITVSAVAASTFTIVSNVDVQMPVVGANATITNNYAQRWVFDNNNYGGINISSAGNVSFSAIGSSAQFTFFGNVMVSNASITTNSTLSSAAFFVSADNSTIRNSVQSELLFAGATTVYSRIWERSTTNFTPAANCSYSSHIVGTQAVTIPATGTSALFANYVFNPISITAGAGTLINSATVYINGAATGATNNYGLWALGLTRFDGDILLGIAGNGISIKQGANATCGRGTLIGGTLTISTTKALSASEIFITDRGGTVTNLGTIYISSVSNGVSFTVTSTNPLDISAFSWFIVGAA